MEPMMPAKKAPTGKPMTPEAFQAKMAELNLTRAKVCAVWQVSEGLMSKWANGKVPIPGWVRYALAGVPVVRADTTPIAAPSKPTETPKPVAAPKPVISPTAADEIIDATHALARAMTKKPKDDGRPFRYVGGRKVYLD